MKILCILIVHNAAQMLPFTFRHYDSIVDEYWVFDDHSTDNTRKLLIANPKVKRFPYSGYNGLSEDNNLRIIYETYPKAVGRFDWVITPDPDEFVCTFQGKPFKEVLELAHNYDVIRTNGYNLLGPHFPTDDGRQIYQINPIGVRAPVYGKPIIFRPSVTIRWVRGKHALENCNPRVSPPMFKIYHARYFGADHTRERNAINYDRLGADKGAGWSVAPNYDGPTLEGSPTWSEHARQFAVNVLNEPLYD